MNRRRPLASVLTLRTPGTCLAVLGALLASCGGGGGGGGSAGTTSFQVSALSVQNGMVWEINREIVFTFTEPVDFSTVSANTINIRSTADVPATGVFTLRDPNTVVFQPTCPTREDLSDAGLRPGVDYVLRLVGRNTSANTLRSIDGVPLGIQQVRTFSTPATDIASIVFEDTRTGPPVPILRPEGSAIVDACRMVIGGDDTSPIYFERDPLGQPVLSVPGFESPLNLYSDASSSVVVIMVFNQPVNPSADNISQTRLRLEFQDPGGTWRPIDTRVVLTQNCTESGATVTLAPIGVLPQASLFRVVVRAGFQDIVGETVSLTLDSFALAPTEGVEFTSLNPADLLSDEINESFVFGGSSALSFEDTTALFDTPVGEWGGGRASASFSFEGAGGPNGDFDWVIRDGEIFIFDTTSNRIDGGPGGVPTTTQNSLNGIVDVRNLHIQEGGELRIQGPNPLRLNATGEVRIDGRLDVSGFNAKNVATLNTGNQVEVGGAGVGGGGRGGNANENTSGSTPRGGNGNGPFRQAGLGGQGGEMGYNQGGNVDSRRPGGGGGGRFKDWPGTTTPEGLSVVAGPGNPGNPQSTGAETGARPALGGNPGSGPFLDSSSENDFFGTRPVVQGGSLVALVKGELPSIWAGYGGGGGGNAGRRYPDPNWNFSSDEKGGGGGGGAGGIHIKALGRIVFGPSGLIVAIGGRGAHGENTNFLDHVGGSGGNGSGGHVVLESAAIIDFSNGGFSPEARSKILATGLPIRQSIGGNQGVNACCLTDSNGGSGGGGLVQLHVPDPVAPPSPDPLVSDIVIPADTAGAANPLDLVSSPPAIPMVPTFGARSKLRSKWISIGGADQDPGGAQRLVRFLFDGIETSGPDAGRIETVGSTVEDRPYLLQVPDLTNSATTRILPDGFTVEVTGLGILAIRASNTNGVGNDVYLRTPSLLKNCVIRLGIVQTPQNFEDFEIVSATFDEGTPTFGDEVLLIHVETERGPLTDFNPGDIGGKTGLQLLPRFFEVVTNDLPNFLPETAFVKLRFQAARDNGIGAPDTANPLVDWTSDISQFNAQSPGELQFFRYEIEFDLDAAGTGVTAATEPVSLEFLKIPFVF